MGQANLNTETIGHELTIKLAYKALEHYNPNLKRSGYWQPMLYSVELKKMGFCYWQEVIEKYQAEIGF